MGDPDNFHSDIIWYSRQGNSLDSALWSESLPFPPAEGQWVETPAAHVSEVIYTAGEDEERGPEWAISQL